MSYKTYWKDVFQSFKKSKGRFLSIMSLMGLGAFALIGLKVTAPNMEKTAQSYQNEAQTMDVAVMADYGLSQEDQTELKN
jgi:putative ABC transport system permease protein